MGLRIPKGLVHKIGPLLFTATGITKKHKFSCATPLRPEWLPSEDKDAEGHFPEWCLLISPRSFAWSVAKKSQIFCWVFFIKTQYQNWPWIKGAEMELAFSAPFVDIQCENWPWTKGSGTELIRPYSKLTSRNRLTEPWYHSHEYL
jgi:hypothetical protein